MTTLVKRAVANVMPRGTTPSSSRGWHPIAVGGGTFLEFARSGFAGNSLVYAGINLISSSAAEPHIAGRRYRRNKRTMLSTPSQASRWGEAIGAKEAKRQVKDQASYLRSLGVPNRAGMRYVDTVMQRDGYFEEVEDHPLVQLLNNPNPYMSRGRIWATVAMDYHLAGNAYLLKARYQGGILAGATAELWRLRPDRVRAIPGADFISGYEYTLPGGGSVMFDAKDVLHFKTLNPLDDYYGMPPLMSVRDRIAIDAYMSEFLKEFFENGGTGPGAILSVKNSIKPLDKEEARERLKRITGPGNYHETLIIDNSEGMQYEQLGLDRGLRDAIPTEIDAVTEARISMVLGVPGDILGTLIGYQNTSYASRRVSWAVFWDIKMTPLLGEFDDVLNLSLVPEYAGVDEVTFDLTDIRALQEDVEAIQERARKNTESGIWSLEEARIVTGVSEEPEDGHHFMIPTRGKMTVAPWPDEEELKPPPPPAAPPALPPGNEPKALPEPAARLLGRPRTQDDPQARAVWDAYQAIRAEHPGLTMRAIASRLSVDERTLRRYRVEFG